MHPATTTSSRPGAQAALDVQVTVPRGERKLRGCLQVKALRIHPRKTRVCPEQTVNLGAQSGWPAGRKADPTPRPQLPLPAPGLFHLASSTASSRQHRPGPADTEAAAGGSGRAGRSLPQRRAVSADQHSRKANCHTFYRAASSFQFRPNGSFQPWPKDLLEIRQGSLLRKAP